MLYTVHTLIEYSGISSPLERLDELSLSVHSWIMVNTSAPVTSTEVGGKMMRRIYAYPTERVPLPVAFIQPSPVGLPIKQSDGLKNQHMDAGKKPFPPLSVPDHPALTQKVSYDAS